MNKLILTVIAFLMAASVCLAADYQVEIIKVTLNGNHSTTVELKITQGAQVIFQGIRGFMSLSTDSIQVKQEFLEGIKNIIRQVITENASKLGEESKKLEGKKVTLNVK